MFHKCKNSEETKKLFRRLALLIHPDKGGEADLMILLQEDYEISLNFHENREQKKEKDESVNRFYEGKYQKTVEEVYPDSERLGIISEMREYALNHKKFETKYLESICEYLEENGHITSSQYNSLVKVYYAFRMDKYSGEKNV